MNFKQWIEANYQSLFPFMTEEPPLTNKERNAMIKAGSKEDYAKNQSRTGRETETAAKQVAGAAVGSVWVGGTGNEEIEEIYPDAILIPSKKFLSISSPERYIALVKSKSFNHFGQPLHRLIAIYQGKKGTHISKEDIKEHLFTIVGGILYQNGYITHVWIDDQYRKNPQVNLYGQMRNFLRQYYGVVGLAPDDKLTSKSFRASDAKHRYNLFRSQG